MHAALIVGAVVVMIPFAWTVSTSLKDLATAFVFPPVWIPAPPHWENYPKALTAQRFDRYFANSVYVTTLDIVGRLISCSLVAFGFARLRWWGRDATFLLVLATMMLPFQITMIPQFVLFKTLGWVDTFMPLWVPAFFGAPFHIFLLRQFFMTIPLELDDAARIDGCSTFGIYWRIILPLARPALAAVAILTFQWSWNEFLTPLIYLNSLDKFTLPLGLRNFMGQFVTNWPYLMAASVAVMVPVLLVFFFAQKHFIQGVVFTGVKG
ncbi:MAG TPA: carbohydrate ABC transporter permease [Chloroflexota bacterium]|nr:carbohydrate ABC transporter permease [Chloroflexota bacterium]